MPHWLLDTNVVSELRRPRPDPGVRAWFEAAADHELFVSVLVIGEIRLGVERRRRRDPLAGEALERWLTELHQRFADRILPVTTQIADRWGRLGSPDPLPTVDGLLAATALEHGLVLVTRNVGDVEATGVATLDPFAA